MNTYFLIGLGGTLLLGVLLFFYLASRRSYRNPSAAQNYEQIRNKVTLRKLKPVEEEPEVEYSGGFIAPILSGFIVLLVGFTMLGPISEQVKVAAATATMASANVSSASGATAITNTALNFIPFMFGMGVALAGLSQIYRGLSNAGIIGSPGP